MLERAIEIAAQTHKGQRDKVGEPYILHPLWVMIACSPGAAQIVGVLHDVVKDCAEWTFRRLHEESFSKEILRSLDHVTKRHGEDYADFIDRTAQDPIAREVKMADLRDNMDVTRITAPTARDHERLQKYEVALQRLAASQTFG